MSSPRIFNRIPRPFIVISAISAIALAGAGASPSPAIPVPLPGQPAGYARPASAPAGPARSLAARLAISVIPARSTSPHYVLTAYTRNAGYRSPRRIAWSMMRGYGWQRWQFRFLNRLWERESSWNPQAANPYSGAYGIPQAVPAVKMASAGPDWRWSARTQIRWGMRYILVRYGSPVRAWSHECRYGWY